MARIVPNYSAFRKRNDLRVTLSSSRNAVSFFVRTHNEAVTKLSAAAACQAVEPSAASL